MTLTAPHADLAVGPDGVIRCAWPGLGHADYRDYHDAEWGKPVHGETALLERLCLEGFQSGLSWLTILRKRPAFRAAFAGFDAEAMAAFTEDDVERLMADEGIVRNRRKIEAAITNARAAVALRETGVDLAELVWSFRPDDPTEESDAGPDRPSQSAASRALASALKKAGFVFVGPVTAYALMEAIGILEHRA